MASQLFKEMFDGKYDGVASPLLLPAGGVSDGKNVRKVSATGGWKARKGCTHNNTTAIAAASILSLHQYTHPRNSDYHFLAQCNGSLYDATNDPPAAGTTFGSAILASISTTKPGFSDMVGETFVYADGSGRLAQWGGDTPFCTGFLCYDNSLTLYTDFTREVTDNRTTTEAIGLADTSDVWYICSPEIAEAIQFVLGTTVNTTGTRTATLSSWVAGAWSDRSATDTTDVVATKTMSGSGSLTWSRNATDTMSVIGGVMGYWYKVSFSAALSNSIDVVSIKLTYDMTTLTNKWDGVYELPLAVRLFDVSVGTGSYLDLSGKLSNESTAQYYNLYSMATGDFLYVKSVSPLIGIGLGIVDGYQCDTGGGHIDNIDYHDGDSWNTISSGITDETKNVAGTESAAQSGFVWWNAAGLTVRKTTIAPDTVPGYWYRISFDAVPDNTAHDVRLYYVLTVPYPEALAEYDGVVEFKGRSCLWGGSEFPNRLKLSAKGKPDVFSGSDSGWTDEFGNMEKIVRGIRFYNELVAFKANSIWLMEGYSFANFGVTRIADTIGCCAPATIQVIETGFPSMHSDEPLSILIWADTDGVYVMDGRKPRKISGPVDQYFNTEYTTTVIAAASLDNLSSFVDKLNNEYHLIIIGSGTGHGTELVYNYITDEWYPPWDRTVGGANDYLVSGLSLRGTDGRYYSYGGANNGRVLLLENDTSDKNASNADVIITHNVKSRAISFVPKQTTTLDFIFRKAWIEAKARSSGTIVTTFFKDLATSGTAITVPAAISLVNSGYSLAVDGVDSNQVGCKCFQLTFEAATADLALEIYSFLYLVALEGEFGL